MKFTTHSAQETQRLAKKILKQLQGKNTVALYGQLGSGKTTFIQGLAKALGIKKRLVSPTYILMRSYPISHNLSYNSMLHLDLYRVSSAADLKSIDFEELIKDKNNLVVVEWAEKLNANQIKNSLKLKFKIISQNRRQITIT